MNPKQSQILRWGLLVLVCFTTAQAAPLETENAMLEAALERRLTPTEAQELELVTRLHTTLSVMYRQAVTAGETEQARTGHVPNAAHWRTLIRDVGDKVIGDFRPLVSHQNHHALYRTWLQHLSLSRIGNTIYDIARTQGIPAASSVAFGAFMDFAAPTFCILIGYPQLAPLTWLIPFEIPGYSLGYAIQNRYIKMRLQRLYGGKAAYLKFRQPYYDNLKALHLDGIEDLLIPLTNHVKESNGVVIADASGFLDSFLTRAGLSRRRLNYKNLRDFSLSHKVAYDLIKALDANEALPEQMKAVLLLHYLDEHNEPEILGALHDTFSKSFIKLSQNPHFEDLAPWVRKFARARSLEEVEQLMRTVPKGTPATLVAQLWKDSLLPMVIQNNPEIRFRAAIQLKDGFYPLLASATSRPSEEWSEAWADEFSAYTKSVYPAGHFPEWGAKPPVALRVRPKSLTCGALFETLAATR